MDLELSGRSAVITGGSRGIGFAIARALGAEGCRVSLLARDAGRLAASVQQLRSEGIYAVGHAADTNDDESVASALAATVQDIGGVQILVNAAARPSAAGPPLAELVDDDLRAEVETKVLGYLRCIRHVAPGMVQNGWGRIINVGGLAARRSGSYFGTIRNVAVAALTKNLADELGPQGINVTVVHPWLTDSEATDALVASRAATLGIDASQVRAAISTDMSIGRMVRADEVASVVAFLASPRSVAINGDAIAVGGGLRGAVHY